MGETRRGASHIPGQSRNHAEGRQRFLQIKRVNHVVREDLAKDYQALVDHHSEEIVQLLEEFGESHIETTHDLHAYEA